MQGKLVPAAQYLRMSTEQQQYSLLNQAAAIAKYADLRGFAIVKTYEDAARSGLVLRERPGLRELLKDVVASDVPYKAILVYDVSRWGRFQDSDESAAYEFICKSAGVPVHYCAEQFANDCSISSSVMKALKRAMAAEYSRELGVKSYEGQKRLVELGFKMGGSPGYGLRRMLLSPTGERLRVLKPGEYKAVSSDRVILVPGPKCEVSVIRRIFSMALKGMNASAIARELNRLKIKFTDDHPWTPFGISRTLKHRKYVGCSVWGQTSRKLHGAGLPDILYQFES
jgi:DNA invertase Pin-like site-specific DNA recombinase